MPNWCYNNMSVHGDRESLERLTEAITRKDDDGYTMYDLTVLFPIPDDLRIESVFFSTEVENSPEAMELAAKQEANLAKYGYKDWYDWCWEKWGTKWSPRIEEWEIHDYNGESTISAYYETAWSPCDKLIREVSRQFPTLLFSITSDEEGGSFACCEAYKAGELVAGFGFDLPDSEALPEELRVRYKSIEERMEADDDTDVWQDKSDWDCDVKQHCEDIVWNELRDKGFIPRLGV